MERFCAIKRINLQKTRDFHFAPFFADVKREEGLSKIIMTSTSNQQRTPRRQSTLSSSLRRLKNNQSSTDKKHQLSPRTLSEVVQERSKDVRIEETRTLLFQPVISQDNEPPSLSELEETSALKEEKASSKDDRVVAGSFLDTGLGEWIAGHKEELKETAEIVDDDDEEPPELDQPKIFASTVDEKKPTPLDSYTRSLGRINKLQGAQAITIAARLALPLTAFSLPLPRSLEYLESVFEAFDAAITHNASRGQPSIVHSMLRAIEIRLGNRVTETGHFAQIQKLWPEAYPTKSHSVIDKGKRVKTQVILADKEFSIKEMWERMVQFRWRVIQFLHERHEEFLKKNGMSSISINDLRQWHADFKLEGITVELDDMKDEKKSSLAEKVHEQINPKAPTKTQGTTLLERLKAKQKAKEQLDMQLRKQLKDNRLDDLLRLIDKIRTISVTSKKASFELRELHKQLGGEHQKKMLEELVEMVPGWLSIVHADEQLKTGPLVLKMDRRVPILAVRDRVKQAVGQSSK